MNKNDFPLFDMLQDIFEEQQGLFDVNKESRKIGVVWEGTKNQQQKAIELAEKYRLDYYKYKLPTIVLEDKSMGNMFYLYLDNVTVNRATVINKGGYWRES